MRNIAFDIGNTSVKAGIFENDQLQEVLENLPVKEIPGVLKENSPQKIIVSTVDYSDEEITDLLTGFNSLILNRETPLPIRNNYQTPETLGVDRLAAAVGAYIIMASRDRLVIDAGTAINYEFVDKQGNYWGGGIAPGLFLRYQSLNNFTANLPLITGKETVNLIGQSTEESIKSGVINGTAAEINGIIARYMNQFEDLAVILCGGDSRFFESTIKAPIFVVPELVLIGLNGILRYNETNN